MARTAHLRRQHDSALELVGELSVLIAERPGIAETGGAFRAAMLLARLSGLLRIHFAQEDRHLYPGMMASGQGGGAETARRFFEEMGHIGGAYTAYTAKWAMSQAIQADADEFRRESTALFAALADRIARENDELYPLADAMFEESQRAGAA